MAKPLAIGPIVLTAIAICLVAGSCAAPPAAAPTKILPLAASPRPTPTPLAVEPTVNVGGSFYKPPGWDGSDVNCKDFDTRAHAQSFFVGTKGSTTNDPFGLDGDHDAKACETLP